MEQTIDYMVYALKLNVSHITTNCTIKNLPGINYLIITQ